MKFIKPQSDFNFDTFIPRILRAFLFSLVVEIVEILIISFQPYSNCSYGKYNHHSLNLVYMDKSHLCDGNGCRASPNINSRATLNEKNIENNKDRPPNEARKYTYIN